MISISNLKVSTTSLVSKEDLQKIVLQYECSATAHLFLSVYKGADAIVENHPLALSGGLGSVSVMLPLQSESFDAIWQISDRAGNILIQAEAPWKQPREWTLYIMVSSHTDIGLHNSQYIQRHNTSQFIDSAAELCDETKDREENDRYRYTMEGTWFWNNYGMDRGKEAADRIVKDYIKTKKIGMCTGIAGNHIQTYGLEQMCRSTYEKRLLKEHWDIESETLAMIDNNGLPWSMVQAYANAGYKNIIFAPNQWNPLPSTVWSYDRTKHRYIWHTGAGGGGSRIDLRLESSLPMVFDWESKSGERLTVWGCSHYVEAFGFYHRIGYRPFKLQDRDLVVSEIEDQIWKRLELLERKVPYDLWVLVCYGDDQEPNLYLTDQIRDWNKKWKFPQVRTLGDPNEPFRLLRERFGDQIPVLKGDITGGWYQHPLTVPELIAQKFDADRALPNAEKWATVAGTIDKDYAYPATDFRRAWDHLLFNDEHSYGTSGYSGRRVYETWMQHRDWIEKATETAEVESKLALQTIASHIKASEDRFAIFNPTAQQRTELVVSDSGSEYALVKIPSFGYASIPKRNFAPLSSVYQHTSTPPTIENSYYKIQFCENGSICSIYDKELDKELLDLENTYRANEPVYTRDNHSSFSVPSAAEFEVCYEKEYTCVRSRTSLSELGAEIVQDVTLPHYEKRIDIDDQLHHVSDMINCNRYYRYLYYAFPFQVENCRRFCHLNGAVAEYAKDVTGHGTDVYMAVNEWCCSENDTFGVALMMRDTHMTEFDHIHADKTDFGNAGEGSQIFSYVANDWLQMHTPGGSHLNYRFRYSITSYKGGYKAANIPQMAERFVNPVKTVSISAQDGDLPEGAHSFMDIDPDLRLVCLKRADDGNGMIARFYTESDKANFAALDAEPATVDERPTSTPAKKGFITYRLGKEAVRLKTREPITPASTNGAPASIGSVYTGLITRPRAAAGENSGHLYLLWGANVEKDLSHYKLYRSEQAGFEPSDATFVADVLPEEYVVGRYEDTELKEHAYYYYRVCAVNTNGVCGPMSEEFSACTREMLNDTEGNGQL
ncbi:MAG: hypothetical protein J6B09_05510 [Clostridia bacterium]|nr:hypothetical protein [Clostridia bacterium]